MSGSVPASRRNSTSVEGSVPACLIYCRVSTDEQTKGYSLPTQEDSCRRFAAERGYAVVGVFRDAHSGTELDRPGLYEAFEAVEALKPAVVLLHDVDRLGRDFAVQAIAERELTRHGARVEYVLGGGTDSADGILLKGVKQALAVYENYQRVERSRRGKLGRAKAGHVNIAARPPYGYRYISGERSGKLEPDPVEGPVVAQMFRWCVEDGLSTYQIAKLLFEAGIPSKADGNGVISKSTGHCSWDPNTVGRILRNETHKGVWYWNKTRKVKRGEKRVQEPRPREEWISVSIPAIVDEVTWERAQRQLDGNKLNARRNAKRDYLLRGLIFCQCGRRWVGRYKNHLDRAYYRCPATESEPWRDRCTARFGLEQTKLETAVVAAVRAFLLNPEARAEGVDAEMERRELERARLEEALSMNDRRLAEVQRRLGALLDQALTGGFPAEVIEDRKRDLLADRDRLEAERARAESQLVESGEVDLAAAIQELGPVVEQAFANANQDELRRLLELLKIEVHPVDRETVRLTGIISGPSGSFVPLSP